MLYDAYKQKLAKRRRVFDCVWRFRALILAGVLLLLAAVGAMLGVKGIIYEEVFPESGEYGRPLAVAAKSVFGKTSLEYRPAGGGEWAEGEPLAAGEYEVRAVAKSIVGTDRHGKSHTVTILPAAAEIRVESAEIIYGEKPVFSADMQYGDVLEVNSYTALKNGNSLNVSADLSSVRAVNSAGEDVTSSYVFTVSDGTVRELPRPITVRTPSDTFVYDGKPHSDANLEASGLKEGDKIKSVSAPSFVKAGSYPNTADFIAITDETGEDVTERYDISYEIGTITVTPRPITVKTDSDEFTYDGIARYYNTVTVSAGELAADDKIAASTGGKAFKEANEDGYINDVPFDITDGDGNSVADCYEITRDYGAVTVRRRRAEILSAGKRLVYNGDFQGFDGSDYSVSPATGEEGLAPSDRFFVNVPFTALNAGEYENRPVYSVIDGDGRDVTASYDFTESLGGLEILKRSITVCSATDEFTYDGQTHEYFEDDISVSGEGLAKGDELRCEFLMSGYNGSLFRVAEANEDGYIFQVPFKCIADENGGDVTENYEIAFEYGKIIVHRRPLKISAEAKETVYNGEEQGFEPGDYRAESLPGEESGLCAGHYIDIVFSYAAVDAGEYENASAFAVMAGAYDATENYIISKELGKLKILPKDLSAETATESFVYDGKPHSDGGVRLIGLADADGDTRLTAGELPSLTKVGETENRFDFGWEVYRGDKNVSENYRLSPENISYGKISVVKREVALSMRDLEIIYDGKNHSAPGYDVIILDGITTFPLVEGDHVELEYKEFKEAGTYVNSPSPSGEVTVYDAGGNDVSENYHIIWSFGSVKILKRPLSVRSHDVSWIYDGLSHPDKTNAAEIEYYDGDDLGHTVKTETSVNPVNAGTYRNFCTATVYDEEGYDVTENYDISYEYGVVGIMQRPVCFGTGSYETVYDGEYHSAETCAERESATPLLAGHRIEPLYPRFKDWGEHSNDPGDGWKIYSGDGSDVSSNYLVSWDPGEIVITRREITLVSGSDSCVYDGEPHKKPTYGFAEGSLQLAAGHTLTAQFGSYTEAGTHINVMSDVSISDGAGADATANYIILYENGAIEIARRRIYVVTPDGEWEYDGEPHSSQLPTCSNLADGQHINFTVSYSPEITDAGELLNELAFEWRVYDGAGRETTQNYILEAGDIEYGLLKVNPREITLNTGSAEFVYDGTAHTHDAVNAANVADGQNFEHTASSELPSLTDAGETDNIFTFDWSVYDKTGRDVTDNYVLSGEITYGIITVKERRVVLRTHSAAAVYDGEYHSAPGFDVIVSGSDDTYPLVEGDRMEPEYSRFVNAGKYDNIPAGNLNIYDVRGNDVTKNYIILWDYGTVEISLRPLKVITPSCAWRYDGQNWLHRFFITVEYYNGTSDSGTLESGKVFTDELGHTVLISDVPTDVVDVGIHTFFCTATVHDEEDNDVTENYDITYDYGDIILSVRELTVLTGSDNFMYDGQGHSADSFTVISDIAVAVGQTLKPDYPEFVDAGYHENRIEDWKVYSASGEDVSENYKIIWQFGTVRINPRPVTVSTGDDEWVYDGTVHGDAGEIIVDYGEYPSLGHIFARRYPFAETNAGKYLNSCEVTVSELTDDGDYRDVTDNYDISYGEFGYVTIRQRHVKIETASRTWVYDKQFIENGGAYVAESIVPDGPADGGLLANHRVTGTFTRLYAITDSETEAAFVDNELIAARILSAEGLDCTDNYLIEYEWGKLRVKSAVEIYIYTISKQYDGSPLSFTDEDYFISKLPPDVKKEDVKIRLWGSLTEPDFLSIEKVYSFSDKEITCEGENRIDFVGNEIVLEVTKRVLHIATASIDAVRGDDPIYGKDAPIPYWISYGTLLAGHHIDEGAVEVTGELLPEQQEVLNTISNVKIFDENGVDVSDYYEIEYDKGTLRWVDG